MNIVLLSAWYQGSMIDHREKEAFNLNNVQKKPWFWDLRALQSTCYNLEIWLIKNLMMPK